MENPRLRRSTVQSGRGFRHAFNLIELLVVIGIISVLFSMLLPSLTKARERGQRIACIGQLRQIMFAAQIYLQENDTFLPPIKYRDRNGRLHAYTDLLDTYLGTGEIWLCPGGNREPPRTGSVSGKVLHYGINLYDYDNADGDNINNHLPGLHARSITRVRDPEQVIYMADSDPMESPEDIGGFESGTRRWPLTSLAEDRHSMGYNGLFLDGSSRWRSNLPNHAEWAVKAQ